mgnify:CR=1 FL=1|tara:strand:- start:36 stop:248 length:213 start_codon:yes stop_codon:yes gene_type:complete
MPSTDAIAITTEDVDTTTSLSMNPKDAYEIAQKAMGQSQEAYDSLDLNIKNLAKKYAESTLDMPGAFQAY